MTTEELGRKRCEELGLKTHPDPEPSYYADDIHYLLGDGVEVVGTYDRTLNHISSTFGQIQSKKDYDSALLIGIRPIKQPSREEQLEELVRELIEREKNSYSENPKYKLNDWLAKAKSLLERKL